MGGHPADLDRLTEIATRHKLTLIEDCAHAHGSQWCGRPVGTFGRAGTFSFQQSKLMTAGEGGMIITNDDDAERLLRSVHDCGRLPGEWFYSHFMYGSNYRLSEWQGAILGAAHPARRANAPAARQRPSAGSVARGYRRSNAASARSARDAQRALRVHFYYDRAAFGGLPTERFIEAMIAEGIPNQAAYPPVHSLDVFTSGAFRSRLADGAEAHPSWQGPFPITERAAWETYWVPQYALLGDEQDMHEIAAAVRKIQQHESELR